MNVFIQDLKQALRSLRHSGWQAAISAIGLAVGLVCLTFSLNWLWTETHYDSFRPGYKDLYVVATADSANSYPGVSYKVIEQLDGVLDGQAAYGIYKGNQRMKCFRPDSVEQARYWDGKPANSGLLDVLGVKVLRGSAERTLDSGDLRQWVVTQSMAQAIFGTDDVVGQSLEYATWNGKETVVIGAVIEDCTGATNIGYDFIMPYELKEFEMQWGVSNYGLLLRTSDPERTASRLDNIRIPEDVWFDRLSLRPLRTLHKLGEGKAFVEAYFYPLAFVTISLILALGALINLIVVYTSVFLGRIREYMLRCSLGASTWKNAGWMLVQMLPVLVVSLVLALLALEWGVAEEYVPGGTEHVYAFFGLVLAAFVVLVLAGTLYPLQKMRRACRQSFSGLPVGGKPHAWLLAVQCLACAFMLFLSWSMQHQISGMIHADLGYERQNMLRLYTGWKRLPGQDEHFDFESIFETLPQEFMKESASGIKDALAMRTDIFNSVTQHWIDVRNVSPDGMDMSGNGENAPLAEGCTVTATQESDDRCMVAFVEIPYRAQEFFGLRVDGSLLSPEEERDGTVQVLMNSVAAERYGIGRSQGELRTGYKLNAKNLSMGNLECEHVNGREVKVSGTVDIRLRDFYTEEEPVMFVGVPEHHECYYSEYDAIYVKHEPGRRADAEAAIRRVLGRFDVPEDQIILTTLDEYIAERYRDDAFYADLLTVLAASCIFVTLAGVVSMLLYSLRMQRRSMAIRRVMGADFREIFLPNLGLYAAFVLVGGILAYFPAVVLIRKWFAYFYFGDVPGAGLMACILAAMLLVVFLIVWGQVHRCMNEKPVEVLRPES